MNVNWKHVAIVGISIIIVLICTIGIIFSGVIAEKEKCCTNTLYISGPDAIEVGGTYEFSIEGNFNGQSPSQYASIEMKVGDGNVANIVKADKGIFTVRGYSPGQATIVACFMGIVATKTIMVYEEATLILEIDDAIFSDDPVDYNLVARGVIDPQLVVYNNKGEDITDSTCIENWGTTAFQFNQAGNYRIVVNATAESNGRDINYERFIVVSPAIKEGALNPSFEGVHLYFREMDWKSISILLEQEYGISANVKEYENWKKFSANSFRGAEKVFYRDIEREDELSFMKNVKNIDIPNRGIEVFQKTIKSSSGRSYEISVIGGWIVTINDDSSGNTGWKNFASGGGSSSSSSSSSGSSGGGDTPSGPSTPAGSGGRTSG